MEEHEEHNFIQLYEGDGLEIVPESTALNFQCCQCGHIHYIKIEHKEESVILRFPDIDDD